MSHTRYLLLAAALFAATGCGKIDQPSPQQASDATTIRPRTEHRQSDQALPQAERQALEDETTMHPSQSGSVAGASSDQPPSAAGSTQDQASPGAASVTLEEFTRVTMAVAAEDGIEYYLPVLAFDGEVRVIEGIPEGVDHREAIQEVARDVGLGAREFLFGVRSGPGEITTGRIGPGKSEFMTIRPGEQGLVASPCSACAWWEFGS